MIEMGLLTNLLMFYFAIAVMFLAFGVDTAFTEIVTGTSGLYDATTGTFLGVIPITAGVLAIGAALAGIALAVGSAGIPVVLGLFVGIIILPLFTFPTGLINASGMPFEFQTLGVALFTGLNLLFVISVVSYAKGSGD